MNEDTTVKSMWMHFLETELSVNQEVFLCCERVHVGKIVKQNNI